MQQIHGMYVCPLQFHKYVCIRLMVFCFLFSFCFLSLLSFLLFLFWTLGRKFDARKCVMMFDSNANVTDSEIKICGGMQIEISTKKKQKKQEKTKNLSFHPKYEM